VTACASCGRDNEPATQFCMDGGKPLERAAALETAAAGAGGQGAVSVPGTRTVVAHSAPGDVATRPFGATRVTPVTQRPRRLVGGKLLRIEPSP